MKRKTNVMIIITIVVFLFSCQNNNVEKEPPEVIGKDPVKKDSISDVDSSVNNQRKEGALNKNKTGKQYTTEIIHSDTLGYGYKIFVDGKLYILQPHIPAINGNKGFQSAEDAIKAANLMVQKIENNILPPAITLDELKKMRIKY